MPNKVGLHALLDRFENKSLSYTEQERKSYAIHGLLPAVGLDSNPPTEGSMLEHEYSALMTRFHRLKEPLDRYDWLMQLSDTNTRMFYMLLSRNPKELMPFVYTPTVGAACQELGLVYRPGRGMFITIEDKGNILNVLGNWPQSEVKAICVTDGERILGLGDLGAFGMGIPVGKLALYTALAGIDPRFLLPITLDVGTNNEKLLQSPHYFGLRRKRVTGQEYDDFIDELMQACVQKFGKQVLIQFEDFANHNAFRLLKKYEKSYCTFNDDIQGTASVVLAGVLGSQRITGRKLSEERIVCFGAGEAALGLAELAVRSMELREGLSHEEAKKHIYMVDSKGLIVVNRSTGGLTEAKLPFARPAGTPECKDLLQIVKEANATSLIGASAVPQSFGQPLLELMSELNERPIIMALSNPTHKAECTAEQAYTHTKGQAIFSSGSPFDDLTVTTKSGDKKARRTGQANNAYVFPGVALAIVTGKIFPVTNDDFLVAAETVAAMASQEELDMGTVFPSLQRIREVSAAIANKVILAAASESRSAMSDPAQVQKAVQEASCYPFDK